MTCASDRILMLIRITHRQPHTITTICACRVMYRENAVTTLLIDVNNTLYRLIAFKSIFDFEISISSAHRLLSTVFN